MRTIFLILSILFCLIFIPAVSAQTDVSGDILTSDTTWTIENSPYEVHKTVQVAEGVTLTLEPGVSVHSFGTNPYNDIDIEIWGELHAIGDLTENIILKCVGIQGKDGSKINIEYAFFDGQPCGSGNRVSVNGGELNLRKSIFNNAARMHLDDSDIVEQNIFMIESVNVKIYILKV